MTSSQSWQNSPSFRLLIAMGTSSLFVFLALFAISAFALDFVTTLPVVQIVLLFFVVSAIAATLFSISVEYDPMVSGPLYQLLPLTAFWSALTTITEIALSFQPLTTEVRFGVTFVSQSALVFLLTYLMANWLQLKGNWPVFTSFLSTALFCAYGSFGLVRQSWIDLDLWTSQFGFVRNLLVASSPILILMLCLTVKGLRLSDNPFESLRLRLGAASSRKEIIAATFLFCGSLILVIVNQYCAGLEAFAPEDKRSLSILDFSFLAIMWLNFQNLREIIGRQRFRHVASKLVERSATRFLLRHDQKQSNWATTVGIRTSMFMIDHDPSSIISDQFPATLLQIRNEEIHRSVSDLLGPFYLHNRIIGSSIFGVMDPETTVRPCVDTLMLFSCLHLDALPLIERRLRGLARLMPIVDEDLSKRFSLEKLESSMIRNQWMFFFNYDWADQVALQRGDQTQYSLYVKDLQISLRYRVFKYLCDMHGTGNFIILGIDARNRLCQEAPILNSIIEAAPIPVADLSEDYLVFMVKFEQLIPRLQRYYALDAMRQVLANYEPSGESLRFIEISQARISASRAAEEILETIAPIVNYPFRGFKEKDLALEVIVQGYLKVRDLLTGSITNEEILNRSLEYNKSRFISAISRIGYPSQLLHLAQLNKISIRKVSSILQTASNPELPRFHEAWLLLASSEAKRYQVTEINEILHFLWTIPENKTLRTNSFVLAKAVETLSCLTAAVLPEDTWFVFKIINKFAYWFATVHVEANLCLLLLDCFMYLRENFVSTFTVDKDLSAAMESYITMLAKTENGNALVLSLKPRWAEICRNQSVRAA